MTVTVNPTSDHNYFSTVKDVRVMIPDVFDGEASGGSTATSSSSSSNLSPNINIGSTTTIKKVPAAIMSVPFKEAATKIEYIEAVRHGSESDDEGLKGAEALLNLASRNKRGISSQDAINISRKKSKLMISSE